MPLVVIIEDDPDISDIAQRHISRNLRATVKTFAEGAKALRWMAEGDRPDLVILDLSLPDISGFEVCHTLRSSKRTESVPVLILSARSGLDDHARAEEVGADAYLEKPVRTRILVDEARRLIENGRTG